MGCHLFWLSVCLWVLFVVGSFFGGSFPQAGYLRVSLSPTSCFLLCRCGQVLLEMVLPCGRFGSFPLALVLLFVLSNFFTIYLYFQVSPGLTWCGFPSLLHLLLFLYVGVSFVGGFPLPGGILVFTASTYSFL